MSDIELEDQDEAVEAAAPITALPVPHRVDRLLTAAHFQQLADVPAELEWFANLGNASTRRAYENALQDFMHFTGIAATAEFRTVTRAHVIAWRDDLVRRVLSGMTVRHPLAALSSLFKYLCEKNTVTHNPVKGVKRPPVESYLGKTPAIGDHQARQLLDAPDSASLKGKRDRAMLAILLHHALRREELCTLTRKDLQDRRGMPYLVVHGKGGKTRYVPLHPAAGGLIYDYLDADNRGSADAGPLFRPMHERYLGGAITADAVYKLARGYSRRLGFEIGAHSLRATAATNALDHEADIAKVQEWLGHANIATTRIYDRRTTRPDDSPTFKVSY